jgi:hypothetical protein
MLQREWKLVTSFNIGFGPFVAVDSGKSSRQALMLLPRTMLYIVVLQSRGDARPAAMARVSRMFANVAAFAVGCTAGAILYGYLKMWCFAIPPILALVPILMNATREPV